MATTTTKRRTSPVDVRLEYHGSLYLLRPLTAAAKQWLLDNIHGTPFDEVTWFGGALVVEPRYVADLLLRLRGDGLRVQ
jgi:hypothetical protein